jgi:hypothetical protein
MSWKDFGDGGEEQYDRTAITFGDLRDAESATFVVEAEPETFDSDEYGEGIRIDAEFVEADLDYKHSDDAAESGDVEQGDPVSVVTWSRRLGAALGELDGALDGGIVGAEVTVTKVKEPGNQYGGYIVRSGDKEVERSP